MAVFAKSVDGSFPEPLEGDSGCIARTRSLHKEPPMRTFKLNAITAILRRLTPSPAQWLAMALGERIY